MTFNFFKLAGRKPIKERGIKWEEAYEERSAPLKKRFEKAIGPGAYRRWAGHDYTTSSEYFIVVGPSIKKGIGKMFFAGIKKVPMEDIREGVTKVYSPYGEYFPNIKSAFSYATKKWGVPFPKNQANYDRNTLAPIDIPKHIKA
jgi:hypothetical protein